MNRTQAETSQLPRPAIQPMVKRPPPAVARMLAQNIAVSAKLSHRYNGLRSPMTNKISTIATAIKKTEAQLSAQLKLVQFVPFTSGGNISAEAIVANTIAATTSGTEMSATITARRTLFSATRNSLNHASKTTEISTRQANPLIHRMNIQEVAWRERTTSG